MEYGWRCPQKCRKNEQKVEISLVKLAFDNYTYEGQKTQNIHSLWDQAKPLTRIIEENKVKEGARW